MKNIQIILFALIFIFYACSSEEKIEEELPEEHFIGLTNIITQSRKDEPIIISRELLEELTTIFPAGTIPLLTGENGEEIPFQADDLNGDGVWDEISFIYSVLPKYTAPLKVDVQPASSAQDYKKRTNVIIYDPNEERSTKNVSTKVIAKPDKASSTTAVAFENEKVAFKIRFSPERLMEIIGKRTDRMILNSKDFEKQGFMVRSRGKRLFHHSDSLKPGTIVFMIDSSFFQLNKYDSLNYQIITQGPLKSVLKINYKGIKIKNKKFDFEEIITIWAKEEGYRSNISFSNLDEDIKIATTISNRNNDSLALNDMGGKYYIVASYNFKENEILEAFGILMPHIPDSSDSLNSKQNEEVYIPFQLGENNSAQLYYYFGWQGDEEYYKTPDDFHSMLDKEVNRLNNPIEIARFIPE